MSVVKLKVYSKKWQSPLKVTAVSVFGLFKELLDDIPFTSQEKS